MYDIRTIEQFQETQLYLLEQDNCVISQETETPDGILVRSSQVPDEWIQGNCLVISRAGVGVDTINIEKATENGTAVLNTPGVNANAVKELILTCLLLSSRHVFAASQMVQTLDGEDILKEAESRRSEYIGQELQGKTVGILGLGAIGRSLARSCYELGMEVLGYARNQYELDYVEQVDLLELLRYSDFIVVVLPLTEDTRRLLNNENLCQIKPGAQLLNFGRGPIVDSEAVLSLLEQKVLGGYITDFPQKEYLNNEKIIMLPHIGGTTQEALEGGDRLAIHALRDFLLYGTVRGSVNFPFVRLLFKAPFRLTLYFKEESRKILPQIMRLLDEHKLQIGDMASNHKGEYVYMLIDLEAEKEQIVPILEQLLAFPSMKRVRLLERPR